MKCSDTRGKSAASLGSLIAKKRPKKAVTYFKPVG
jgi:hypothetical protein